MLIQIKAFEARQRTQQSLGDLHRLVKACRPRFAHNFGDLIVGLRNCFPDLYQDGLELALIGGAQGIEDPRHLQKTRKRTCQFAHLHRMLPVVGKIPHGLPKLSALGGETIAGGGQKLLQISLVHESR